MSENNQWSRELLASEILQKKKEIKILEEATKKLEKKLMKKMEQRTLDKEFYKNGLTATIVKSTYPKFNMIKYSSILGIDMDILEEAKKEATEIFDRSPYIKVY